MVFVYAAAAALVLYLLYILVMGFAVFYKGLSYYAPFDRNYDPARGDLPLSPRASQYRRLAQEGNRWWNTLPPERCEIRSRDGLLLRGGLLQGRQDSPVAVLVVHGHRCCAGEMGFISRMYHEMGFHVLAIDQRAHGASEGIHLTMGHWERFDVADWAAYLHSRFPAAKLVLHGCSMGAATVLYASALPLPQEVCCCIEDCGYTCAGEAFLQELRVKKPRLPFKRALLGVTNLICRAVVKVDLWRGDVRGAVKQSRLPTLFLHGTGDRVVPHAMGEELCRLHPGPKQLELFDGAAHAVSYFYDKERYTAGCRAFIARFAGTQEAAAP